MPSETVVLEPAPRRRRRAVDSPQARTACAATHLENVATRALTLLGGDGAVVSVSREGSLSVAASVPVMLSALEGAQLRLEVGPCYEAGLTKQPSAVADLAKVDALPLQSIAKLAGVRGVLSVPILDDEDQTVQGVLSLYSVAAREWTETDTEVLEALAALTGTLLVTHEALQEQRDILAELRIELDTRVVVEQAKGILASAHAVSVGEAYAHLRAHARRHDRPLAAVAADVVATGALSVGPPPPSLAT